MSDFCGRPWPRDASGRALMVSELNAQEFRLQVASAEQEALQHLSAEQLATLLRSPAAQRSLRASAIALMLCRNAFYAAGRALRNPNS